MQPAVSLLLRADEVVAATAAVGWTSQLDEQHKRCPDGHVSWLPLAMCTTHFAAVQHGRSPAGHCEGPLLLVPNSINTQIVVTDAAPTRITLLDAQSQRPIRLPVPGPLAGPRVPVPLCGCSGVQWSCRSGSRRHRKQTLLWLATTTIVEKKQTGSKTIKNNTNRHHEGANNWSEQRRGGSTVHADCSSPRRLSRCIGFGLTSS